MKNLSINNAIVAQAESDLPLSGYNTDKLFVLPVDANGHSLQTTISSNGNVSSGSTTANNNANQSNNNSQPALDANGNVISTTGNSQPMLMSALENNASIVATPTQNVLTYLLGPSNAPNGFSVRSLTYFPDTPNIGEYVLRTDYLPNVLFRWDGVRWSVVNEVRRSPITGNTDQTQLGTFVNNTETTKLSSGKIIQQRQALSKIFSAKSDF
jgi:hypothetical protein